MTTTLSINGLNTSIISDYVIFERWSRGLDLLLIESEHTNSSISSAMLKKFDIEISEDFIVHYARGFSCGISTDVLIICKDDKDVKEKVRDMMLSNRRWNVTDYEYINETAKINQNDILSVLENNILNGIIEKEEEKEEIVHKRTREKRVKKA